MHLISVSMGQIIYSENEDVKYVYFIRDGEFEITKHIK
jgi:CRP-like cAMP-binding protein